MRIQAFPWLFVVLYQCMHKSGKWSHNTLCYIVAMECLNKPVCFPLQGKGTFYNMCTPYKITQLSPLLDFKQHFLIDLLDQLDTQYEFPILVTKHHISIALVTYSESVFLVFLVETDWIIGQVPFGTVLVISVIEAEAFLLPFCCSSKSGFLVIYQDS